MPGPAAFQSNAFQASGYQSVVAVDASTSLAAVLGFFEPVNISAEASSQVLIEALSLVASTGQVSPGASSTAALNAALGVLQAASLAAQGQAAVTITAVEGNLLVFPVGAQGERSAFIALSAVEASIIAAALKARFLVPPRAPKWTDAKGTTPTMGRARNGFSGARAVSFITAGRAKD